MNKYVHKLFGIMFQNKQTQQAFPVPLQHSPASPEEWRAYWQARGFPWRTEPEIDAKRQEELSKHRVIIPDIEKGIYPFKEMKLSRADVEWLLATHENGRGPVDWSEGSRRGLAARRGLDLRGADLQFVDLSRLPLTNTLGGLSGEEWVNATAEQREEATAHLEGAFLRATHLEDCSLSYAHLEGARLHEAHLEGADLYRSHLEGKHISPTDQGRMRMLKGYSFTKLPSTDIAEAFFDAETKIDRITLCDEKKVGIRLGGLHWGGVDVTAVEWKTIHMLGDEYEARQPRYQNGKTKTNDRRLLEYQRAIQANGQLAAVLQSQGMDEDARRFAYRARILQRKIFWKQRNFWKWLGSAILALLAGYGYRMWRILVAYLFIVLLCGVAYFVLGMYYEPHLSFLEAVLTSVTAFHGRVFSEPFLRPGEPQLMVTAFEAVMGLVIEGVFIAMLTQKFFSK